MNSEALFFKETFLKYPENSQILNGANNLDTVCSLLYSYAKVQYCLGNNLYRNIYIADTCCIVEFEGVDSIFEYYIA